MTKLRKRLAGVMFSTALAVGSVGCGYVPPGHVGVMINLYGSNRGVQDTTIVTGRVWYNPMTKQIWDFPTFMQYAVWTANLNEGVKGVDESITFVSKDRIQVNVDVSVAYQFEAAKVPELFITFRQTPDVIANTYIRSRIRDAFVKQGGELNAMDILGAGVGTLDKNVTDQINLEMKSNGIQFDYISVVGHPRIPSQIQDAINSAIESTQKAAQAQNQVAVVQAQAKQAVAEADGKAAATLAIAEAQAKANQLLSASLTPELVQSQAIQKWNGEVPMYSGGTSPIPFLNLGAKASN